MGNQVVIGRGKIKITIDDGIQRVLDRLTEGAAGRILAAFKREGDAIESNARANWPIGRERKGPKDGEGRPHSRDTIFSETWIDPSGPSVSLRMGVASGDHNYVFKIKSGKNGLGGGSPWQQLLRKPAIAASKRLTQELGPDLIALAGGKQ